MWGVFFLVFLGGLTSARPFSFSKLCKIQILIFLLKAFGGNQTKDLYYFE